MLDDRVAIAEVASSVCPVAPRLRLMLITPAEACWRPAFWQEIDAFMALEPIADVRSTP